MSKPLLRAELGDKKEKIIENLTKEQEEVLQNIHAEQYSGTDDDMPDAFVSWLMELTLLDLEDYLEYE